MHGGVRRTTSRIPFPGLAGHALSALADRKRQLEPNGTHSHSAILSRDRASGPSWQGFQLKGLAILGRGSELPSLAELLIYFKTNPELQIDLKTNPEFKSPVISRVIQNKFQIFAAADFELAQQPVMLKALGAAGLSRLHFCYNAANHMYCMYVVFFNVL